MNEQQLKTLKKTVECGSLSKAEETLYLSKQAIKKQIDSLEEEIGFTLLLLTAGLTDNGTLPLWGTVLAGVVGLALLMGGVRNA